MPPPGACDDTEQASGMLQIVIPGTLYGEDWTPAMEADQLRRQQEEAKRQAADFKLMDEGSSAGKLPPDNTAVTFLSNSDTTGLRYICVCPEEKTVRAVYLKRIRRPYISKELQEKYPWLGRWCINMYKTCHQGYGKEDTFKAAVCHQMLRALETCEAEGHIARKMYDEKLRQVLGDKIEFTDCQFPMPDQEEFGSFSRAFCSQQFRMLQHVHDVTGTFKPGPSETWPEHLRPLAEEQATDEVVVVDEEPATPDTLPLADTGTEEDTGSSEGTVMDVVVDAFPEDETAPKWPAATSEGDTPVTRSPSKGVQTSKKIAEKWAKDLLIKKKLLPRKLFHSPPRGQSPERRPPPPPDYITIPDVPSPEEPELQDTFLEDEPTDGDYFEQMAYAGVVEDVPDVPCKHGCIQEALNEKRFVDPKRYCVHVRRALAMHVVRHPDQWGVSNRDREMLSILASLGYIRKDILTKSKILHEEANFEDRTPVYDLQRMYNVEVANRFEVLFDEPDMMDLQPEDLAEGVKKPAHEAQREGRRRPKGAKEPGPEREKRKQERQAYTATHDTAARQAKPPEQRRRDAKAAMKRILAKVSDARVSTDRVAMTILRGNRAPQVDQLLQEWHRWLRYPTLAIQKGLLCWLACCRFNQVDRLTAVTMVYKRLNPLSELCAAPGSCEWIRDLTEEGVEPNPGPGVSAPVEEESAMVTFEKWCTDRSDVETDMVLAAKRFVEREITYPSGVKLDINFSVISPATWQAANSNQIVRLNVPTLGTTLYPSMVITAPLQVTVLTIARREEAKNVVLSVPLPSGEVPDPCYHVESPRHDGQPRAEKVTKAATGTVPWKRGGRLRPKPGETTAAPTETQAADAAAVPSTSVATSTDPTPTDEARELGYPTHPRVIVAGLDDRGLVTISARSLGPGVAFAASTQRFTSNMWRRGVRTWVVGRVNSDGDGVGSLRYAERQPIIGVQRGEEEEFAVLVGGNRVSDELSTALRGMKTDQTCTLAGPDETTYMLLGEWFSELGNRVPYDLDWRGWGPIHYTYNARTGYREGTELKPTPLALAMTSATLDDITITPRLDLTARGLDRTTAEALALSKPPGPSSCEANALKLGLMAQWARFGSNGAARQVVLTGQVQVHEPGRRIRRDTPVTRLCNNSGKPLEDCGGTICPTFPFMEGWKRGRIRFYASAQCVPTGRRYLLLPASFENNANFSEAAALILSFLPWPFANLSLAVETSNADHDDIHTQVFSWYGTTTVVPGELELDVVLHMSNVGRTASRTKDDDPVLVAQPTMGGTAVEFWPPYAPININYRATQTHYVPAAAFAVSWINTFSPGTINNVLQKIAGAGLFDGVERWVNEAQILTMNHTGIMATEVASLQSTATIDPEVRRYSDTSLDSDIVPLLYRCWEPMGSRLMHVPSNVNWCNLRLTPSNSIVVPDLFAFTRVVAGFYEWSKKFGQLSVPVDSYILAPAMFVASEKLTVGWHIWHGHVGLPTRGLAYGAECREVGKAESLYYAELFSDEWTPADNGPQAGCVAVLEKVVGGRYLRDAAGDPVFYRAYGPMDGRWQPQVWDLEDVNPLDMVCPTPMSDAYVFKYTTSLPRCLEPFLVSRCLHGNKDIGNSAGAIGNPPKGYYGPYKFKSDGLYCYLEPRALPWVVDQEVWENRLMHAMPEYSLRQIRDGIVVEGGPRPGQAPFHFPRKGDDWSGEIEDYGRPQPVYPFFSTVWSGWVEPDSHEITELISKGQPDAWFALLEQGIGGMSDGLILDRKKQPVMFQTTIGASLGGGKRLGTLAGNASGGGSMKQTGSGNKSENQSDEGLNASGNPPSSTGDKPQQAE